MATVDELVNRFNRGENVDLESTLNLPSAGGKMIQKVDPHTVAALLKRWFRELPEPLCTSEMYDMWMAAAAIKDHATKITQLKKVLSFCPPANQNLIRYLAKFLKDFSLHSEATKMTSTNLSICFAPNLLRAPDNIGLADQIEESPIATSLLVLFIEEFELVFDIASTNSNTPSSSANTAPKQSSLTANLLPPPSPSSTSHPPEVASKKPIPKYANPKGLRTSEKSNRVGNSSPLVSSSSGDFPRTTEPVALMRASSPELAPLPPPLENGSSHEVSATHKPTLPPAIPPKPKLRESAGKPKSATPTKNEVHEAHNNNTAPAGAGPQLPPPLNSRHSAGYTQNSIQTGQYGSYEESKGHREARPPRPTSSAPNFLQ